MTSEDILCQMRQVQDNTFQMQDGADGAVVMHARGEGAAPRKTRATEVHTPQTDAAQSQGRGRSRTRGASRGRGRSMSKAPSDCPRNGTPGRENRATSRLKARSANLSTSSDPQARRRVRKSAESVAERTKMLNASFPARATTARRRATLPRCAAKLNARNRNRAKKKRRKST